MEETNKRVIEESDKVPKKYLKGKRLISQPLTFFLYFKMKERSGYVAGPVLPQTRIE